MEVRCCCCAFSVWHAARISALKPSKFSEDVTSRGAGSRPGVACGGSLRTVLMLGVAGATDAMLPAPTGPGPIPPADQSQRCSLKIQAGPLALHTVFRTVGREKRVEKRLG